MYDFYAYALKTQLQSLFSQESLNWTLSRSKRYLLLKYGFAHARFHEYWDYQHQCFLMDSLKIEFYWISSQNWLISMSCSSVCPSGYLYQVNRWTIPLFVNTWFSVKLNFWTFNNNAMFIRIILHFVNII